MSKRRERMSIKSAKISGTLDLIVFFGLLAISLGYILIEWLSIKGIPEQIVNIWNHIPGIIDKGLEGKVLDTLSKIKNYPGMPLGVAFAVLAIIVLLSSAFSFKQGISVFKKKRNIIIILLYIIIMVGVGLLFAEKYILSLETAPKWGLLGIVGYLFIQIILKINAYTHAY